MLSILIENFAQQSDLFAVVKAVCEQMIPYAEHTYGKLCSVSIFFAAQFLAF